VDDVTFGSYNQHKEHHSESDQRKTGIQNPNT